MKLPGHGRLLKAKQEPHHTPTGHDRATPRFRKASAGGAERAVPDAKSRTAMLDRMTRPR